MTILEFVKTLDLTSPEANTNVWIFIVSTIICVVGFLAMQIYSQSGKLTGMKTDFEVLRGQVDTVSAAVNNINSKLDRFLKAEIDVLKDLADRKK